MISLLFGVKRLEKKLDIIIEKLDLLLDTKETPDKQAFRIHNKRTKMDAFSRLLRKK